jgi:hypothetical protein
MKNYGKEQVWCGKHDHMIDQDNAISVGKIGNGEIECITN